MQKQRVQGFIFEETVGFSIVNPTSTPCIDLPCHVARRYLAALEAEFPGLYDWTDPLANTPDEMSVRVWLPSTWPVDGAEVEMRPHYDRILAALKE